MNPSNLPPGVTNRDIDRAAGCEDLCPICDEPMSGRNKICSDCAMDRADHLMDRDRDDRAEQGLRP